MVLVNPTNLRPKHPSYTILVASTAVGFPITVQTFECTWPNLIPRTCVFVEVQGLEFPNTVAVIIAPGLKS